MPRKVKYEAVTIKDLARELGLSTSTISRALRDSHEISPDTKNRVIEHARKVNYHPNPIALSLRVGKTMNIGIIVSEIANSFFAEVINGVESIAIERGYNVIIAQSRESAACELRDLKFLTSRSVDGLLISVSTETSDYSLLRELHRRGLPLVFFDRVVHEIDTHKVTADNYAGAFEATIHLIGKGYRRIALVTNASGLSITAERESGYRAALQQNGISVDPSLIRYCDPKCQMSSESIRIMDTLFDLPEKPDAVLSTSDTLTIGCFRYLQMKGIRIPEEMAIIGYCNSELTGMFSPPLSVIRQPAFDMGEAATRLLLDMIESKRSHMNFSVMKLPAELIFRGST
jgi:DNA-binding LacI/PurR family transcriptional regulator